MFFTYTEGLAGPGGGGGATLDLYLYTPDGHPMLSGSGQPVCAPCQYSLQTGTRRVEIGLEQTALPLGGLPAGGFSGFAVAVSSGPGADHVFAHATTTSTGSSPRIRQTRALEPLDPNAPAAATYVLPHVFETSGKSTQFPFYADTRLDLVYAGGLPGVTGVVGNATADLYYFDTAGNPVLGTGGAPVCNPCSFALNSTNPHRSVLLDDLITAAGGFTNTVSEGTVRLQLGGSQPQHLAVAAALLSSGSATGRLESVSINLEKPGAGDTRRTYVIPHVFEQKGRLRADVSTDQDTVLHLAHPGALGAPAMVDSFFDIFFLDEAGHSLKSRTGQPVCNPCTVALGGGRPVADFRIQQVADAAGGFTNTLNEITVRLEARGPDAGALCFSSWDTTTRERRFDQSRRITGMPGPLGGATNTVRTLLIPRLEMDPGRATERAFNRDTVLALALQPAFSPVFTNTLASVNIHLYDSAGQPMRTATGKEVCNPCTATLDAAVRKRMVALDDLVANNGGSSNVVKMGFAVIVVGGDGSEDVNIQGFVVNRHTSPFDLAVFGFEPEPIRAATMAVPGRLDVRVEDTSGLGLPGARVIVRDAGGVRADATTDEEGELTLDPPASGGVRVFASSPGWAMAPPFFDIPYPSFTNVLFNATRVAPDRVDLRASLTVSGAPRAVSPGQVLTLDAAIAHVAGTVFTNTLAELRLPAGFQVLSFTNNVGTASHDMATQRILFDTDFTSVFTNTLRVTGTVLTEPPANRLVSLRGSEDCVPGLFPLRRAGRGDLDEYNDGRYRPPLLRLSGVGENCDRLGDLSAARSGLSLGPAVGLANGNHGRLLGADGLAHTLASPVPLERIHLASWADIDDDVFGTCHIALTQHYLTPLPSPALLACTPDTDADGYGDVAFAQTNTFGAGQTVVDSLVGDMDADGFMDVVVLLAAAGGLPGEARIYPATGTGLNPYLGAPIILATPANPACMLRCDLNQDGRADLVVASANNLRVFSSRADGSGNYDPANVAMAGLPTLLHRGTANAGLSGQPPDNDSDVFAQIGQRLFIFENTPGAAAPLTANGFIGLDAAPPAEGVCVDCFTDDDDDGARITCYIDPTLNQLKGIRSLSGGGYGPPEVLASLRPGATRVFSYDGSMDSREPMMSAFTLGLTDPRDQDDDQARTFRHRLAVVEPGSILVLSGPGDDDDCDDVGNIYPADSGYRLVCGKTAHLRVATGDVCGDGIPDLVMLGETGVLNFTLHAGGDLPDPTPEDNSAAARLLRSDGDANPPTVSIITAPNGGPVIEGQAVAIDVQVTDDVGVVRVDLIVQRPGLGDTVVHVFGRGDPLSHTFFVPHGFGGQAFRLGVNAYDADGNIAQDSSGAFNVLPGTGDAPPTVSLLLPPNLTGMFESPSGIRAIADGLAPPPVPRPGSAPGLIAYQVFRLADPVGAFTNGVDVATHPDAVRWSTAADGDDPVTLRDALGGVDETALYTLRPVFADGTLGDYSAIIRGIHRLVMHQPELLPTGALQFWFPTAPGERYTLQSAGHPAGPFIDRPGVWIGNGIDVQAQELLSPTDPLPRLFQIKRTAEP